MREPIPSALSLSSAADESARLRALTRYDLLDTPAEAIFDDIARLASAIACTPIALMSLVDSKRQWFKARVGLNVSETGRDIAFCAHAINGFEPFIIDDAYNDPRFRNNPLVVGEPKIRFYAGFPIRSSDGHALGTLCVIDREPRKLSNETIVLLSKLTRQLEIQIEMRSRLADFRSSLKKADALLADGHTALENRQLTALIVHDLRSPLNAIGLTTGYLRGRAVRDEADDNALQEIEGAVESMQNLVMDLLDVGGGSNGQLIVHRKEFDLNSMLANLDLGFQRVARARELSLSLIFCAPPAIVHADESLVRRLLQNLIENALKFTPAHGTVRVTAEVSGDRLTARVSDSGTGIVDAFKTRVFDIYSQFGSGENAMRGRGLGLAFCKLAVEAHDGRIWVEDSPTGGSCFCFDLVV